MLSPMFPFGTIAVYRSSSSSEKLNTPSYQTFVRGVMPSHPFRLLFRRLQ